MRLFIIALLFAISYAQTDDATTTTCVGEMEVITICTTDAGCRCHDPDHEQTGLSYQECEDLATDQGYDYFSVKEDKCRFGSAEECLPTANSYGWATYEIQTTDCTTDSPTTDVEETTTQCVPAVEDRCEGCRCTFFQWEGSVSGYDDCIAAAMERGHEMFSHKDGNCRTGAAIVCTGFESKYGWNSYEIIPCDIFETTAMTTECFPDFEAVCEDCQCKPQSTLVAYDEYVEISIESCAILAMQDGASYFSVRNGKCKTFNDNCGGDDMSAGSYWDTYRLLGCVEEEECGGDGQPPCPIMGTSFQPQDSCEETLCDACPGNQVHGEPAHGQCCGDCIDCSPESILYRERTMCKAEEADMELRDIIYNECAQLALENDKEFFSYNEVQSVCRIPMKTDIGQCVQSPDELERRWNTYQWQGCEEARCRDTYFTVEANSKCVEMGTDISFTDLYAHECMQEAILRGKEYFSYSVGRRCRIPFGYNIYRQCFTNRVGHISWTVYQVSTCDVETTSAAIESTEYDECASAVCVASVCTDGTVPPIQDGECCPDVSLCIDNCAVILQVQTMLGGDMQCFYQDEYPEYQATRKGVTYENCEEGCEYFDGVPSAGACHDIVKNSAGCHKADYFHYAEFPDGRCSAKRNNGNLVDSRIFVMGAIDRDNDCTNPIETTEAAPGCRIRRSWTLMSQEDREHYLTVVTAVQDAFEYPDQHAEYNTLVQMHELKFNDGVHWVTEFLPWHRWFLLQFENILRQVDPDITVPYWAWEMDAALDTLWSNNYELWGPNPWQFGSIVEPVEGCVVDGPMGTDANWVQSDGISCLQRGQSGKFDDLVDIQTNVYSKPPDNWKKFSDALEAAHDGLHCVIDGTMCSKKSAEDPLFFLHHANIDRHWSIWQSLSEEHKYAQQFESNYNDPMVETDGARPADYTDLSNQNYYGVSVCVQYQDLSVVESPTTSTENTQNLAATIYADVLNMLEQLPNDEEFWKHIAHTGELSLDDARKFIATISSETTGVSYEVALVFANEILEQSGRTEYVEARHVAQPRNESAITRSPSVTVTGDDMFSLILGVSQESVKEELEREGLSQELKYLENRVETLDRKYDDERNVCDDPNPCAPNGSCSEVDGDAVCDCGVSGYTGPFCDENKCDDYCENGGTCTIQNGDPECSCDVDFTGAQCEQEICGYNVRVFIEGKRCRSAYDDHRMDRVSFDECLSYFTENYRINGYSYFSYNEETSQCRIPHDETAQCVDDPDRVRNWNIHIMEPEICTTTEGPEECETHADLARRSARCSGYTELRNGLTLSACLFWAQHHGQQYFSYSSDNRCDIPLDAEIAESDCIGYGRENADGWHVYRVDDCSTTTADPNAICEYNMQSAEIFCEDCKCDENDDDFNEYVKNVLECTTQAIEMNSPYFSYRKDGIYKGTRFKCRVPVNPLTQCVQNKQERKRAWDMYIVDENCVSHDFIETTPIPDKPCPESVEFGESCVQYEQGRQCNTDYECFCGKCGYKKDVTCSYGSWQGIDIPFDVPEFCADSWPQKDCKVINKEGDCFAQEYYDSCPVTCGTDYDLPAARTEAGINDEAIAVFSGATCLYGSDFVDSRGFDCDAYEGAGWCWRKNGKTISTGWCAKYPKIEYKESECSIMPGRKRFDSFDHYANFGLTAQTCCCNTDIADTYEFDSTWDAEPQPECVDKTVDERGTAWHDERGWSCRAYHFGQMCTDQGKKGLNWNAEWGSIKEHTWDGMHALQACCTCGGGETEPNYEPIPGTSMRRMDKYIDQKPRDSKTWNRINKFTKPLAGDLTLHPADRAVMENMYNLSKQRLTYETWAQMMTHWSSLQARYPYFPWREY